MVTLSHTHVLQPHQSRPGPSVLSEARGGKGTTNIRECSKLTNELTNTRREGTMRTYAKWEWLTLKVGVFGTGGLGVISAFSALWGVMLGYPVLSHSGIAGLVAAFCIGAAASIALRVSGAWSGRSVP